MTSAVEAAVEAADEVSQSIRADFFCSCSLKRLWGTRGARPGWAEFGFSTRLRLETNQTKVLSIFH